MPTRASKMTAALAAAPLVTALLCSGLVAGAAPASAGVGATVARATCTEVRLPVAMQEGGPVNATLAGTLCRPQQGGGSVSAVDILVHGGMYNREYWNWPVRPELYSYVQRTVDAGRATFFYDRFGAGRSTRPAKGRDADFKADVHALHQTIQWLRGQFDRVNVIGHSLGSVVAVDEAGRYNDADSLVITGLTHGHGLGFLTLPTAIWTAFLDPQFQGDIRVRDGGYVTTQPGKRRDLFYSSIAEPAVVAYDEAHKDVMTLSQTSQAINALSLPPLFNRSTAVTRPVLLVVGQLDAPFCGVDVSCVNDIVLTAAELPYYIGARSFTARVIANTGHDLPLHPTAPESFGVVDQWLRTTP